MFYKGVEYWKQNALMTYQKSINEQGQRNGETLYEDPMTGNLA